MTAALERTAHGEGDPEGLLRWIRVRHRSVLAQLGLPDMRVPILYCLGYPERLEFGFEPFNFARWRKLEFELIVLDVSRPM